MIVKRRCQLIVKIKAIKYFKRLLCNLSFYNLLVLDSYSGFWPLYRCYWQCNHYYRQVCLNCIADYIALIVSLIVSLIVLLIILFCFLWPYDWLYCFDCSDHIADCIVQWYLVKFSTFRIIFTIWLQSTSGSKHNSSSGIIYSNPTIY